MGGSRHVHRVEGWKKNLQSRLNRWMEQIGPKCPKCSRLMVERKGKNGYFWGCSGYPGCRQTPGNGVRMRGKSKLPKFHPESVLLSGQTLETFTGTASYSLWRLIRQWQNGFAPNLFCSTAASPHPLKRCGAG